MQQGMVIDPLAMFVHEQEPSGESAAPWRAQLQSALEHVAGQGGATAAPAKLPPTLGPHAAWQPMATCPKETKVFYDLWTKTQFRLPDCRWMPRNHWLMASGQLETDDAFTHWRLSPLTPEEEAANVQP